MLCFAPDITPLEIRIAFSLKLRAKSISKVSRLFGKSFVSLYAACAKSIDLVSKMLWQSFIIVVSDIKSIGVYLSFFSNNNL